MRRQLGIEQWVKLAEAAHFRADELAQLREISIRHLRREFRRIFGFPPKKWLEEQRMRKAERLLLERESVKSVAFELGFKDPSHFCHQFKLLRQMTPSEFVLLNTPLQSSMADIDNRCPQTTTTQH